MDTIPAALPDPFPRAPDPAEAAWRRWRHGVVRDLAWVLASPPLLQPAEPGDVLWLDAAWSQRAWSASESWLAELDHDPSPLQELLVERPGRLGTYFESLLAFWLAWPGNPLYRLRVHGLPVRRQRLTLGELDFLVEDRASGELQHWEVAVKFYLGTAAGGRHRDWVGPGLRDRLDLKVERLCQHQLGLSRRPEARQLLQQLHLAAPQPVCLLKGRLFYPAAALAAPARWAPCQSSPQHLTGWWMDQAEFLHHFADSRLTWTRLPREHWLSPVNLDKGDASVRIGEPVAAAVLVERLRAASDNRAAAVVGLRGHEEVTRGFITPLDWPQLPEPL